MTGRGAAMFHYVAAALLVLACSSLGDDLNKTSESTSPGHYLLPSLREDPVLLSSQDPTHDLKMAPFLTHHTTLYDLSKPAYSPTQTKSTLVSHLSPSVKSVLAPSPITHTVMELDVIPTDELRSSSTIYLRHIRSPTPLHNKNTATHNNTHATSNHVLVMSETGHLRATASHALSSSSSRSLIIHSSASSFAPSPVDPFLSGLTASASESTTAIAISSKPPHHNSTVLNDGSPLLNKSIDTESATVSQEEYNSILTRFSLDALQATQMAERLGLAGTGMAELEQELLLGGDLQGPGGPSDRPRALPLDRNIRTTSQRSFTSSISHATKRLFLGDPTLCYSGTCEFFLLCWISGGLIEGGCGGFLFACCVRHNQRGQRGPESYRDDSVGLIPVDYGPIRNDQGCGLSVSSRLTAQRRIVGGTEAGFGSFPWQVRLHLVLCNALSLEIRIYYEQI